MAEERRLVWRVLRHWQEIERGGRFPRRNEIDHWLPSPLVCIVPLVVSTLSFISRRRACVSLSRRRGLRTRPGAPVTARAGHPFGNKALQIRARWPWVRILLRAGSGFAREGLMRWCELNGVDYLFGLARTRASP
jgi:hypothetical protein